MRYKIFAFFISIVLFSSACVALSAQPVSTPKVLGPSEPDGVKVILQRLEIEYLGQDGHRVIGSGCPGTDGKGSIEDYHFVVRGVDIDREVQRVLVAGDNSTLTWEWPCSDAWGLMAKERSRGVWNVYIAPSLPTEIYTLIFFYDDNTMALGMVSVP